ncbi:HlyD family efflux transporter periplasmic adaptor subunit, partial [Citreicella sp. C3M06]|nr:HlyD family efflux transporter periplasmic adaptor subunit [Citreicella sp. C3M06]
VTLAIPSKAITSIFGEELETTLHRYVWLYNQQLPQSALGSKSPLQAMKDWHTLKPALIKKQPYYPPGCNTWAIMVEHSARTSWRENDMRVNKALIALLAVAALGVGYYFLEQASDTGLPEGIAFGNGQVEAVQVDVSSLIAGRVASVMVKEGDLVEPEQLVALLDADVITAQLAQAQAEVAAANAQVVAAEATIAQAEALMTLAEEELTRTEALEQRGTATTQVLDSRKTDVAVAQANLDAAKAALVSYQRGVDAAVAAAAQVASNLEDTELTSPTLGRVLYRLAEPGEVISAGSKVLTIVDLSEVYLEFFLPATQAHRLAVGSEARIKLDVVDAVVPATVTFVSPVSQFTPRSVETADERQNLVFRVRARIPQELVQTYIDYVRTGIRGVAYVRLAPTAGTAETDWPEELALDDLAALPILNQ